MSFCATMRSMLPTISIMGSAPPFQRNQFGGAVGGPIQKDKTFFFANFEGFIQNLHQTSVAFVPDLASRAKAVPSVQPLLNLWPTPTPSDPDFSGIAQVSSSPLQTIREYFGNARFDHTFSANDTFLGGVHHRRRRRRHADLLQSLQHRHTESAGAGRQPGGDARFLAHAVEYRPFRFFASRLFLHRRTHAGHAGSQRSRLSGRDIRWAQWWSAEARRRILRRRSAWPEATTAAI